MPVRELITNCGEAGHNGACKIVSENISMTSSKDNNSTRAPCSTPTCGNAGFMRLSNNVCVQREGGHGEMTKRLVCVFFADFLLKMTFGNIFVKGHPVSEGKRHESFKSEFCI